MVKTSLLSGLALLVVVVPAGAAHADDWKGFYAGAYAGGVLALSDAETRVPYSKTGYFAVSSTVAIDSSGSRHLNPLGVTIGGEGGYTFQWNNLVFGAEGDFGWMQLRGSQVSTNVYPCCAPTSYQIIQRLNTDWMATLRARVGWSFGPLLAYATGGAAASYLSYQALFTDTFANVHESANMAKLALGWAVGAGAEYRLVSHWSVKAEYLFVDFGRSSTGSTNLTAFPDSEPFPTSVFSHSFDLETHSVRISGIYRF